MMTTAQPLKNTPRMERASTLNREADENTAMFFRIDIGPNVSISVHSETYCSMFLRLRVNAEVKRDKPFIQPGRVNVEKMM